MTLRRTENPVPSTLSRRSLLATATAALAWATAASTLPGSSVAHASDGGPVEEPAGLPPGMSPLTAEAEAWAKGFLAREMTIDLHCHPGMFFFAGLPQEDPVLQAMAAQSGFQARTVEDMAVGGCTGGLFAAVADLPLIGAKNGALYARRQFKQGEAYRNFRKQLAVLQQMVDAGMVTKVETPEELEVARKAGAPVAIFASEGGDFLENRIERLEESYRAGLRSVGLVHYHINHLGDIQTESEVHGGLTAFGRTAVREMNRLGMIIDLAHATLATTRDAIDASEQPIMVSHSFLADEGIQHPRLLSLEHARMVAANGGLIGSWPSGIGNPDFASFIDRTLRLVDAVGIEHVGLGTDMDANYKPILSNYRQLPFLAAMLRDKGMNENELSLFLGGNFRRLFSEVSSTGSAI